MADIMEYRSGTSVPESVVLANQPAWHGEGMVLDTNGKKGLTVEQALEHSGLDYRVTKVPIFGPKGQEIERRWGVMREDTEAILGVVGETWQPVQNLEGFAILADVINAAAVQDDGYHIWIESAGVLDGGRKVWIMANIEEDWQIANESYRSHLLFANGHDGRTAVITGAVDERVVCANTLNYAVYLEGKGEGTQRMLRVRHTANAGERIMQAHAILGMRNRRKEELARQGEWLVNQPMDNDGFMEFLDGLLPCEQELGTPAATMNANRRAALAQVYLDAPNLEPIRGTRWGALQAVVEYDEHERSFKDANTKLRNQFGIGQVGLPQRAHDLLVAV